MTEKQMMGNGKGDKRPLGDGEQKKGTDQPLEPNRKVASVSRRGLLVSTGGVAALLALGAVTVLGHDKLVRPPGGQDEGRLLSLCVRCWKCHEACPQQVIAPVALEGGLAAMRTPTVNFHESFCDFCEAEATGPLCVSACPTEALSLIPEQRVDPATTVLGEAVITEDWCLAYRLAHCRFCYDACPYEAIELDEFDRPVVLEERCNGCGACESVCVSLSSGSLIPGMTHRAIVVMPSEG